MESLGEKLREAREQHDYSLEQVARDTHISKSYLIALESEDFTVIPGETYIIGFLRNYAEYLSLNPEELVTLYKNMKIQEQPLPMNELLEGNKKKASLPSVLLFSLAFLILGGGGFFLIRFAISRPAKEETASEKQVFAMNSEAEYVFQEEVLTRWFNLEDTVIVPVSGNTYPLKLVSIGDMLVLKIPGGTLELNIGEERLMDLNSDSKIDLRLLLNDLDRDGAEKRANIGFYKVIGSIPLKTAEASEEKVETLEAETGEETEEAAGIAAAEPESPGTPPAAVSAAGLEQSRGTVIMASESPSSFRVSINFRGYCLFRYILDGEGREERFFHKGENFSLDAKKDVKVWISNAGALRVMIAGRDVEMGKPGEVAAKVIRWIKNESSGRYNLEVISLD